MDSQRNLPIVTLSGIYIHTLQSPTAGPYKKCSFQTLAFLCISNVHGSCTNLSSALKLWAFKIQMTAKTTLQWWSLDNGDSFFFWERNLDIRDLLAWDLPPLGSKTFSNKMKFPAKWPSNMVGRGMILYLNSLGRMVSKLSLNCSITKHDETSVGTIPQYPWEPQNSTHASSITERTIWRSSTAHLNNNQLLYQKLTSVAPGYTPENLYRTWKPSVRKEKPSSKPSFFGFQILIFRRVPRVHFNHPPPAPTVRQGSIDSPHSCHRQGRWHEHPQSRQRE